MKNELDNKYSYIKHDMYNSVKRCNHLTHHYERYDFSRSEWVIDYIPYDDLFDYSDITEEEALKIISDIKVKVRSAD